MLDITVHTIAWNEQLILPHFYNYYASFTKHIVVHDNESTEPVPTHPKVTIIPYHSNNEQNNLIMATVKNECWKNDTTEWSLVCDADEFLVLDLDLFLAQKEPVAFRCTGIEMMGVDGQPLEDIARATVPYNRSRGKLDKVLLFHNSITDINYRPGAHEAYPDCPIINGHQLRHYNQLGEEHVVQRWRRYVPRISNIDLKRGLGRHYHAPPEIIRDRYQRYMRHSRPIPSLRQVQEALLERLAALPSAH